MTHEEFARRTEARLLEAAERLEGEARDNGAGDPPRTRARAGGLRAAALLVREEAAEAEERRRPDAGAPPLEAQG